MCDETIDTTNKFLVGGRADGILITCPPRGSISRQEALVLAAWLVSLADRDGEFQKVLAAVQNT
jgi:hypothetical protein